MMTPTDNSLCQGRGCPPRLRCNCIRYANALRGVVSPYASYIANCVPYDVPLTGTDADYPLFEPRDTEPRKEAQGGR